MTNIVGTRNFSGEDYICYEKTNGHPGIFSKKACYEGDANNFMGNGFIIFGRFNRVVGENIKITGDYNIVIGPRATVLGDYNIICGENPEVTGSNNVIYPRNPPCLFHVFFLDAENIIQTVSGCQGPRDYPFIINRKPCRIVFPTEQSLEQTGLYELNWNPPVDEIQRLTEKEWTFKPMRIFYLTHMTPTSVFLSFLPDATPRTPARVIREPERERLSNNRASVESLPVSKKTKLDQTDFSSIENKTHSDDDAQKEPKLCILCEDRPAKIIAWPCRHKKFCGPCILEYQKQSSSKNPETKMTVCPICKQDVQSFTNVYE